MSASQKEKVYTLTSQSNLILKQGDLTTYEGGAIVNAGASNVTLGTFSFWEAMHAAYLLSFQGLKILDVQPMNNLWELGRQALIKVSCI